jgi:hypothetical protein
MRKVGPSKVRSDQKITRRGVATAGTIAFSSAATVSVAAAASAPPDEETLGRLMAVNEIRNLKSKYFRYIDAKNWDGLREIFTQDAVLDFGEGPASLEDTLLFWKSVLAGAISVHAGHAPEIEVIGVNDARAIWPMDDQIYTPSEREKPFGHLLLRGFGYYHETYLRQSGRWRIKTLKMERILQHIDLNK